MGSKSGEGVKEVMMWSIKYQGESTFITYQQKLHGLLVVGLVDFTVLKTFPKLPLGGFYLRQSIDTQLVALSEIAYMFNRGIRISYISDSTGYEAFKYSIDLISLKRIATLVPTNTLVSWVFLKDQQVRKIAIAVLKERSQDASISKRTS